MTSPFLAFLRSLWIVAIPLPLGFSPTAWARLFDDRVAGHVENVVPVKV